MNVDLLMYYRQDGADAGLPTNPIIRAKCGNVLFGISNGEELHGLTEEQFEIVANRLAERMQTAR